MESYIINGMKVSTEEFEKPKEMLAGQSTLTEEVIEYMERPIDPEVRIILDIHKLQGSILGGLMNIFGDGQPKENIDKIISNLTVLQGLIK